MSISSFFSSFLTVVHADASEETEKVDSVQQEAPAAVEEPEAEPQEEQTEAEEPEDLHPAIREECKNTSKCTSLTRHFEHCQEKVSSGQGFKGEDCVEELIPSVLLQYTSAVHMMHCVDGCAAPKLLSKLK